MANGFIDQLQLSELQVITALSLTSTPYKLPQHLLSFLSACCVFISRSWQRLLTVEILQLNAWSSIFIASRAELNFQLSTDNQKVKVMLRPTFQSARLSWNKAPIWGLRPDLYYCQTVVGLLMWGALSTNWVAPVFFKITSQHGPHRKHHSFHCCSPTVPAA
jgi:hypothetical protein